MMKEKDQCEGTTFHLAPAEVWRTQIGKPWYVPETFARDGFIHCTDGEDQVIRTGNRYYQADPRPIIALVIERSRVIPPIVYEDPDRMFPHIYGRLNMSAVVAIRQVTRTDDGTYERLGPEVPVDSHGEQPQAKRAEA